MTRELVVVLGLVCVLASAATVNDIAGAASHKASAMQTQYGGHIAKNPTDKISGSPGSDVAEFPDDLAFAPCDEMSDDEPTPTPTPTPTPQLYPDEDDIAFTVVDVIKRMCWQCGCGCHNMSRSDEFSVATAVFRALPGVSREVDVCPDFLASHPDFPRTPTPTPLPPLPPLPPVVVDPPPVFPPLPPAALALMRRLQHDRLAALRNNASSSVRLGLEKQVSEAAHKIEDHVTHTKELAQEHHVIPPLPAVPDDCGEDSAGSVGLSNDEVASSSTAMNSAYRPAPILYTPSKSLEDVAFLEEVATGCTLYQSMSPSQRAAEVITGATARDCAEACLYDDDCLAFAHADSTAREMSDEGVCELFTNEVSLVNDRSKTTGLCHKKPATPLPRVAKQQLVAHTTQADNADARPLCITPDHFHSALGVCESYLPSAPTSNFVHCDHDRDEKSGVLARHACPECGQCRPTPVPTPFVPKPVVTKATTLPNGDATSCLHAMQAARDASQTGPLAGWYEPQCLQDGSYRPTQCLESVCWCVYTNGVPVPGTEYDTRTPPSPLPSCRKPELAPVMPPPPPEFHTDPSRVAVRAAARLVYSMVAPDEICRRGRNSTFEASLLAALSRPNRTRARLACTALTSPPSLPSLLLSLTRCVVPPLPHSASPSPSPSPSLTATPSPSPSPSTSPPIAMCGDVTCEEKGIHVNIFRSPLPGYCAMCVQGTSGPCRDPKTFACFPYSYGDTCSAKHIRCADEGEHHGANPNAVVHHECSRRDDQVTLSARLSLPVGHTPSFASEWGVVVSSALADVLQLDDLCDVRVLHADGDESTTKIAVAISRGTVDEAKEYVHKLQAGVDDGSVFAALRRRGVHLRA